MSPYIAGINEYSQNLQIKNYWAPQITRTIEREREIVQESIQLRDTIMEMDLNDQKQRETDYRLRLELVNHIKGQLNGLNHMKKWLVFSESMNQMESITNSIAVVKLRLINTQSELTVGVDQIMEMESKTKSLMDKSTHFSTQLKKGINIMHELKGFVSDEDRKESNLYSRLTKVNVQIKILNTELLKYEYKTDTTNQIPQIHSEIENRLKEQKEIETQLESVQLKIKKSDQKVANFETKFKKAELYAKNHAKLCEEMKRELNLIYKVREVLKREQMESIEQIKNLMKSREEQKSIITGFLSVNLLSDKPEYIRERILLEIDINKTEENLRKYSRLL